MDDRYRPVWGFAALDLAAIAARADRQFPAEVSRVAGAPDGQWRISDGDSCCDMRLPVIPDAHAFDWLQDLMQRANDVPALIAEIYRLRDESTCLQQVIQGTPEGTDDTAGSFTVPLTSGSAGTLTLTDLQGCVVESQPEDE